MSLVLLALLTAAPAAVEPSNAQVEAWLQELRGAPAPNNHARIKARSATLPKAKGDVREVYAKVAPGTVLIRTGRGFGTGVVINAKGYVLTNHHVIAPAQVIDFKQQVTVELGRIDADGLMEKDGKPRIAWVLKSDPLLDLAVIKLDDPPADLKPVKIAEKDPVPGEPVSAVGNGGIGLLWAIKDGEISSIGKLATHLALLVGSECQVSTDPAVADACKKSRASLEIQRKSMAERVPGLVIQSSCTISPGDSGGPLVNRAGELVGVNAFLRSDGSAPVAANFHVHVKEVRKFLAEVPSEAQPRIAQPWESLYAASSLIDGDGDGVKETLMVKEVPVPVAFLDLDQDSKLPSTAWPDSVLRMKTLKAELAVRKIGDRLAAFYDTNNDGRFDRVHLAVPKAKAEAFEIGADGSMKKLEASVALIDPGQLKSADAKARLAKVTGTVLAQITGEVGGDLPDPLLAAGSLGNLFDGDKDGKFDVLEVHSMAALVTLLDLTQTELPALTNGRASKLLAAKTVGPRVSFVERGEKLWAFYDTNSDRKFDLVLLSSDSGSGGVSAAWTLNEAGAMDKERPELVGAMLGRPMAAFNFTAAEATRYAAILKNLRVPWLASTRSTTAQPHAIFDVGTDILSETPETAGFANAVLSTEGDGTTRASSLMFDLDKDALKAKTPEDIEKKAAQGTFPAEFAWIQRGRHEWFVYDTNHDGKLDVVLFRADGVSSAAKLNEKGQLVAAPELSKGSLVRPELFTDAKLKAALTAVAPVYFNGDSLIP